MLQPKFPMDVFDAVLAHYMLQTFGAAWRTQCHQTSKIAAHALRIVHPSGHARAQRMELVAMMEGARACVHIGAADDTSIMEGKVPMHFAVVVNNGIYDPTFSQLSLCKTPLDLPPEPYFFVDRCLDFIQPNEEGIYWMGKRRPSGLLGIGYKLLDAPLAPPVVAELMPEEVARRHGQSVAARYRLTTEPCQFPQP